MPASTIGTTDRLLAAVKIFTDMSHDFPSQYIETFLLVARGQGVSNRQIVEATGLSGAAVTRNIQALSPYRKDGSSGYNLVDTAPHPLDGRLKVIFLTEHGKRTFRTVMHKFGHEEKETLPPPVEPVFTRISDEKVQPTYFAPQKKIYSQE